MISGAFGLDVPAIVRTPGELSSLVEAAPQNPLGAEAGHYVAFLRSRPGAGATRELNSWDVDLERLIVTGRDVHLWFDKPSHEAKASNARIERIAGTVATSRGWKVVTALAEKWG